LCVGGLSIGRVPSVPLTSGVHNRLLYPPRYALSLSFLIGLMVSCPCGP
jgi:hypothetical protein